MSMMMEHKKSGVPIPTDSLIAYYPFSGNANDASGNGKNLVVYGAALSTGRKSIANSCYNFDGLNDYMVSPYQWIPVTANQYSLSFWYKFNIGIEASDFMVLVYPFNSTLSTGGGFTYIYNQSGIYKLLSPVYYSDNTIIYSYEATIEPNVWYYTTMTYIRNSIDGIKTYLNGTLLGSVASSNLNLKAGAPYSNENAFGRKTDTGSKYYKGYLQDFRFYSRALTQDEVLALYNE